MSFTARFIFVLPLFSTHSRLRSRRHHVWQFVPHSLLIRSTLGSQVVSDARKPFETHAIASHRYMHAPTHTHEVSTHCTSHTCWMQSLHLLLSDKCVDSTHRNADEHDKQRLNRLSPRIVNLAPIKDSTHAKAFLQSSRSFPVGVLGTRNDYLLHRTCWSQHLMYVTNEDRVAMTTALAKAIALANVGKHTEANVYVKQLKQLLHSHFNI